MKHARSDYDPIQDPRGLIPADEPVFLVRAQDICGPETLHFWARMAQDEGAKSDIIDLVLEHAKAMEDWQKNNKKKIPDL